MSEKGFYGEVQKVVEPIAQKEQLQRELNSILDRGLTVENINTYADEALNSLIELTGKKVGEYKKNNLTTGLSDKEIEDRAFQFYGLREVNSVLDHISQKAEEIKGLDLVIASTNKINSVIIKPDPSESVIINGDGEFKEKRIFDRLKTVLFVLKEDFDVDVADRQQLMIQRGIVSDNMMRKTSYFLLNAYGINRTILVCDEEGNVSYVFNTKALNNKGIFNDEIVNLTKSKLNELITETPEMGKRVIYSKTDFVPRIIEAIEKPISSIPDEVNRKTEKDKGKYFYQKAPEGYLSCNGISKKNGVNKNIISNAIKEINDSFGETKVYKFGPRVWVGYSPEQQQIILNYLNKQGKLRPKPPEGYLSILGITKNVDLMVSDVASVIDELNDQLGEVSTYKFGGITIAKGYSPEQQQIILNYLNKQGKLRPKPPEGYLSIAGICRKVNLDNTVVNSAVNDLGDQLGKIQTYKFYSVVAPGYSLEQQEMIMDYLKNQGKIAPKHPDGYLSAKGIFNKIGSTQQIIARIINDLGDQIGEVKKYKFGGEITVGYSPEQQKLIIDSISHFYFIKVPDGYSSIKKVSTNNDVAPQTIEKAVLVLKSELDEAKNFLIGGKITRGFSVEDQEKIGKYIQEHYKNKNK